MQMMSIWRDTYIAEDGPTPGAAGNTYTMVGIVTKNV